MSMKKTVWTWGLASGGVAIALMLTSMAIFQVDFDKAEILGYTTLVASSLLIYFGVRSYRDQVAGGRLTFGKGFQVGILIALVASLCYVVTWEIYYFGWKPDFCARYTAHQVAKAEAKGADAEAIARIRKEGEQLEKLLENPLTNSAMTFLEPFPFGLLSSLVSAAILKKKSPAG